jgi:hypothetical protein
LFQGIQQAAIAQQGVPHHLRDLDAGGHGVGCALTRSIDAPLQPAQRQLAVSRYLLQKILDDFRPALFEGPRVALRERCPRIEVNLLAWVWQHALHLVWKRRRVTPLIGFLILIAPGSGVYKLHPGRPGTAIA